ncbi:MAG: hypothetical protein QY322_01930 [bacterium]|nr:MAG: hypothetical protein QY322_01930 [bacterium]
MKKIKRVINIVVVLLLCFTNIFPVLIYAQEDLESPTPEATVTSEIEIENTAEVINDITDTSNTGENTIEVLASPTPEPSHVVVIYNIDESPSPSSEPSPTPVSEIVTSDAVSVVEVENNVNTNIINSEFVYHTLNIYLPESGNINLSSLTSNVINKVYGVDNNLSENISVKVTDSNNFSYIENYAYVENNISSSSNTGGNTVENGLSSNIQTGDAYSVVSVLNNVNTNVVDSKVHLVTINIFGNLTGNIILPEYKDSGSCVSCSSNIDLSSDASVNNNISSSSNTGENSTIGNGLSSIETGDSQSVVNVVNIVNTNIVDTVFRYLYINTLGVWIGDFLGWMDEPAQTDNNLAIDSGQNGLILQGGGCVYCSSNAMTGTNTAIVNNNISSNSNTGNNQIVNSEDGDIKTGNAYNSISLVNLVNTNIINSQGFIGFINIFGTLVGDVGGTSMFEEVSPDVSPQPTTEEETKQSEKESGGVLEVTHTNNVGAYVFPGDTITFQARIKNVGYGKVYGAKLKIELYRDGINYGGSHFDLGDIDAQKTVRLSTGLVMSRRAVPGLYVAKVTGYGVVGPGEDEISAESESSFIISGYNTAFFNTTPVLLAYEDDESGDPQVFGESTEASGNSMIMKMIYIFVGLLFLYLTLKIIQKRKLIFKYIRRIRTNLT